MMDMEPHGFMYLMLLPVLLIVLAGAYLGYQLRSAPKAEIRTLQSGRPFRLGEPTDALPASTDPEDLLIVIPDISGYTRFMSLSKLGLAHAHYVIRELLAAVLEAGSATFRPMRLEGDAIVFHASVSKTGPDAVGQGLTDIMRAFDERRSKLIRQNACPCKACKAISQLDLKIIVHHGEVLRFSMGGMEDLSGEAIITAHRLLKNGVGKPRYILVTEGTQDFVHFTDTLNQRPITEVLDSAGTIDATVYDIPVHQEADQSREAMDIVLAEKLQDLGRKIRLAV